MRDVLTIPFHGAEDILIIASDNSGAIGMKQKDAVHAPYELVGYSSFRVAVMECMAAGGEPFSVVLHNFCGNEPWKALIRGINRGLHELNLENIPITGSTESNFAMLQSAIGLVVLGKKASGKTTELTYSDQLQFAVIGLPLVGNEVVEHDEQMVPLAIFHAACRLSDVMVWPVGSKGVLFELNQMFPDVAFSNVAANLDVFKSSGPATCFISAYQKDQEENLKKLAGGLFHPLHITR